MRSEHGGAEAERGELDELRAGDECRRAVRRARSTSTSSAEAGGGEQSASAQVARQPAPRELAERDDGERDEQRCRRARSRRWCRRRRRRADGWSRARTRQTASRHEQQRDARNAKLGPAGPCAGARSRGPYDSPMRVVLLTGIWPPDVGGPATHGPDFARVPPRSRPRRPRRHDGRRRADRAPGPGHDDRARRAVRRPLPARRDDRLPARASGPTWSTRRRRTPLQRSPRAGRPLVAKLVSDPAYERARRYGVFAGSLEEFQQASGAGVDDAQASAHRRASPRRGAIVVPSRYLAEIATGWGLDPVARRGARQPCAASADRRARAARARDTRLRRAPDRAEGAAGAPRGAARASTARSSCWSATGPSASA